MRLEASVWNIRGELDASALEGMLASIPGVERASVAPTGTLDVTFHPEEIALSDVVDRIGRRGFLVVINAVSTPREPSVAAAG